MIRVITPFYNPGRYLENCINSLVNQDVDFMCYLVDDMSDDKSSEFAKEIADTGPRFVYIRNEEKRYPLGAHIDVINRKEIQDNDIIVTLDGDDWLANKNVIQFVADNYDEDTWMLFTNFEFFLPGGGREVGYTSKPASIESLRSGWTTHHMRTFRAGLFRKIKQEDLLDPETKKPYSVVGDMAMIYPMIEMADFDRIKFFNKIHYIYNIENPINEHKSHKEMQKRKIRELKQKPQYKRINSYRDESN